MPKKMLSREARMPGQWQEDSREPSGWRWDNNAPDPDPSPTYILPSYSTGAPSNRHVLRGQEEQMPDPIPSSPDVLNPDLGSDGGGQRAGGALPAIDPDNPVAHVDELRQGPAMAQTWTPSSAEIVACPCCGTGVHPDRIRG